MALEIADELGDVLTYYGRMNSGEDAEDARFNYDVQANQSLSSNFRRIVELLEEIEILDRASEDTTSERRRRILHVNALLAIYENTTTNAGKAQLFAGGEGWEDISVSADFTMQAKTDTFLFNGAPVHLGNTGVPNLVFPSDFDGTSVRILTVPGY